MGKKQKKEVKKHEVLELELFDTKFFDYRIVKPDVATFLFVRYFQEELAIYEKLVRKGYYRNYYKAIPDDYKNWKHFNCFQDLRRWCDTHFIKYKDFWKWAFMLHRELGFQRCFPVVFKNKNLLNEIKKIDKEKYRTQLKLADSCYFQGEMYSGTELQKEYWAYVYDNVKRIYPENQRKEVFAKFHLKLK